MTNGPARPRLLLFLDATQGPEPVSRSLPAGDVMVRLLESGFLTVDPLSDTARLVALARLAESCPAFEVRRGASAPVTGNRGRLDGATVRVRIDGARFTRADVAGEVFLLDQTTGRSYRIGGSGPWLWDLLRAGATVEGAAEAIATETGASLETVSEEARQFVADLHRSGVLEVVVSGT